MLDSTHNKMFAKYLKVQSWKLYNNKTQITDTEIFAFIAVLVSKLMSRKVLFINRKDKKIVKKQATF